MVLRTACVISFNVFASGITVSFREERKFMRTYLSMENYRFQGMTVLWDVGDCGSESAADGDWDYMRRVLSMECMSTRRRQIKILGGVCQNKVYSYHSQLV